MSDVYRGVLKSLACPQTTVSAVDQPSISPLLSRCYDKKTPPVSMSKLLSFGYVEEEEKKNSNDDDASSTVHLLLILTTKNKKQDYLLGTHTGVCVCVCVCVCSTASPVNHSFPVPRCDLGTDEHHSDGGRGRAGVGRSTSHFQGEGSHRPPLPDVHIVCPIPPRIHSPSIVHSPTVRFSAGDNGTLLTIYLVLISIRWLMIFILSMFSMWKAPVRSQPGEGN